VARQNNKQDDVAYLEALWKVRSDEIEETIGLPNCIGLEPNTTNDTDNDVTNASSDEEYEPPGDSADKFFEMYPELAGIDDDLMYSSSDESVAVEVKVETKKRKGDSKDESIIVVSGEDSPKDSHNNNVIKNNIMSMNRRNESEHASSNSQPRNNLNSRQHFNNNAQSRSNHQHQPQMNNNNPYRQHHNQQQQNQMNRQQPPPLHHHQQQQQQKNQWQNRPSTGCFDYNETNQNAQTKENPFRTAKEVQGTLDNNAPNDWDNGRRNNNNGYNRNNNGRNNNNTRGWGNQQEDEPYRGNNTMNNRANNTSRPQELVKTALNGPKQNVSQGLRRKFQNPRLGSSNNGNGNGNANSNNGGQTNKPRNNNSNGGNNDDDDLPEELKGLNKDLIERIENDIVDSGEKVTFEDIAGLDHAKNTVHEMIIMPMRRPDMFTGLREAPRGLLLFGPPGTGKTLIAKAIAHESGATFFSISSSSLTSKWIGEGEQLVKTLFKVARYRQPSVVFIDEVDSMLTVRKADENEASRRMKTEFLVALDGAGNEKKGHVLLIGATNRPHELDDAARRRFVKRLYVALPEMKDREVLIRRLLGKNDNNIADKEYSKLAKNTEGYSGSDLKNLCSDAAMGPVRELGKGAMDATAKELPPISYKHCRQALKSTSPSVSQEELQVYLEWNQTYGTKAFSADLDNDTESDRESSDEEEAS